MYTRMTRGRPRRPRRDEFGRRETRQTDSLQRVWTNPLQRLQETHGNQAAQRLAQQRIQPKLEIGPPDDRYEREAERVARAVTSAPDPTHQHTASTTTSPERVQRMCPPCQKRHARGKPLDCPECEAELQRTATTAATPSVDAETTTLVQESRSGGQPLPASTRSYLEPRFGHEFGDVRLHTDSKADEAARAVGAQAFTLGRDIVFRDGAYRPETAGGRQLLAHELTHVVQQRGHDTASVIRREEPESKGKKEPESKPGTAAAGPRMVLQQKDGACACLVVVHNDERAARQTAQLMHKYCSYSLILVHEDDGKRNLDIKVPKGDPRKKTDGIDPNELFPKSIAEECLGREAECARKRDALGGSTAPKDIVRYTELQFFLSISKCSNSFSLPVVALHNNAINDTALYRGKKGISLRDLKIDLDKTNPQQPDATSGESKKPEKSKSPEEAEVKRLNDLLDSTVGREARDQLTEPKKTNIFRWCVAPDLSRCHIGKPEEPDNVIWTTKKADFEKLSKEDVNVVLQSELPKDAAKSESATDLSTLFLHLEKIVQARSEAQRRELAESRIESITKILETQQWIEELREHGDALLGDEWSALRQIVEELVDILVSLLIEALVAVGASERIEQLRYINIETPKTTSAATRVSNYEVILSVLKPLGLHCCGEDPTQAETNVEEGLQKERTR